MPRIDAPYTYRVINLDLTNGLNDEHFPIHAELIYYHWGLSTLEIKLNAASNDVIKLRPKNKIEAPINRIFISAAPRLETVQLFIANPNTINLGGGEIRVWEDNEFIHTMAQNAFFGYTGSPALVGSFSIIALWNPANSGIHAILNTIDLSHTAPGTTVIYVYQHTAQYLTVQNFTIGNKYLGGPAGVVELWDGRFAGPGILGNWIGGFSCLIGTAYLQNNPIQTNFIVPPGQLFQIVSSGVNQSIGAIFHWHEYPIGGL